MALFHKYVFFPCGNTSKSNQLLLGVVKETSVLKCLLRFADVPEFAGISS